MKPSNHIASCIFYSVWIVGLLIQASFTELLADEAYYWKYAQQLDWGYFDHPPMVALFIKLGYSIVPNELGVRLLFILSSALTIWVWQQTIKPKNLLLFFAVVSSVAILHAVGFIATTDGPFLLFTTLFFWFYRQFLNNQSFKNASILAVIIACMLYTKYHGIVIIGLTLLANIKLVKSKSFWFTLLLTCLLLTPHIAWQIKNNYPSIQYHLFERSQMPYNIGFTLEYIGVQLIVLGPILGVLFFYIFKNKHSINLFEKTLKWCFWGGYLFFLLMSFKGKTEAYWTLFIIVPALFFAYPYIENSSKLKRLVKQQLPFVLVLIFVGRIFLLFNFLPYNKFTKEIVSKYHLKKEQINTIAAVTKNTPVAFMNSYQKASLFEFYSGVPSFSLNNIMGRKNQYDLWLSEEHFRGKEIIVMLNYHSDQLPVIETPTGGVNYSIINNFQCYSIVKIKATSKINSVATDTTLPIDIIIDAPENNQINFNANPSFPSTLYYQIFNGNKLIKEEPIMKLKQSLLANKTTVQITSPKKAGKYNLYFTIKTGWLPHTINSKSYKLHVQ